MAADLRVVAVRLPSPLVSPCPVTLVVTIENAGSDPASRAPFAVGIEVGGVSNEEPFRADFFTVVDDVEVQQLGPGRRVDVAVRVSIPCHFSISVKLRAEVDVFRQVANNAHTAAPFVLTAFVTRTGWLVTSLRVGLEDSSGIVSFDPVALCPDKTLLAEVTVASRGCYPSLPATLEVTLEDPGTGPVPVVLQSQKLPLPGIPVSGSSLKLVRFRTPRANAIGSGVLSVRAVVSSLPSAFLQCNTSTLSALATLPIAVGGPPRLALSVGGVGSVVPGEVPTLIWSIQNDCSDIGTASVQILFGAPPVAIVSESLPLGLRSSAGKEVMASSISIPAANANDFWSVGAKTLTLEIRGSGLDPGPYRATTALVVRPEPVDATWWSFGAVPTAFWKTSYRFTGSFTNRGTAAMSLTALDALEHPTDVVGTGSDRTLTPVPAVTGVSTAAGARVAAAWVGFQNWQWIILPFYDETGPRSRTFNCTARFSAVDAFGNVYGRIDAGPLAVAVSVSPGKLVMRDGALIFIMAGLVLLVAGAVFIAQGNYVSIGFGIAMLLLAWAAFITATFFGASAMDPPVPEFGRPRAGDGLTEWQVPDQFATSRYPGLRALGPLLFRLERALRAVEEARARAWAAFLDGDDSEQVTQRGAAHAGLRRLQRILDALENAAAEAQGEWEEIRRELGLERGMGPRISHEQLVAATRDLARRVDLSAENYAVFGDVLRGLDDERLASLLDAGDPLDLVRAVAVLRACVDLVAADVAEREYTR
jgi:hypothetical protein